MRKPLVTIVVYSYCFLNCMAISKVMDKVFISNHIKLEILAICGLPAIKPYNLAGDTPLYTLNYCNNDDFCRLLEKKLQDIAIIYNTGKIISPGDISKEYTVNDCIKLVFS